MTDLSSDECWTEPANAIDVLETEIRDRRERDPCVNDWLSGVDDYLVVKLPFVKNAEALARRVVIEEDPTLVGVVAATPQPVTTQH